MIQKKQPKISLVTTHTARWMSGSKTMFTRVIPGIPTTIKTMGVNITTILYLKVLIIQIGSTIILMVVEAQGHIYAKQSKISQDRGNYTWMRFPPTHGHPPGVFVCFLLGETYWESCDVYWLSVGIDGAYLDVPGS